MCLCTNWNWLWSWHYKMTALFQVMCYFHFTGLPYHILEAEDMVPETHGCQLHFNPKLHNYYTRSSIPERGRQPLILQKLCLEIYASTLFSSILTNLRLTALSIPNFLHEGTAVSFLSVSELHLFYMTVNIPVLFFLEKSGKFKIVQKITLELWNPAANCEKSKLLKAKL